MILTFLNEDVVQISENNKLYNVTKHAAQVSWESSQGDCIVTKRLDHKSSFRCILGTDEAFAELDEAEFIRVVDAGREILQNKSVLL